MRRRAFIIGAALGLAAGGQALAEQLKHVGRLSGLSESDALAQAQLRAFEQAFAALGWIEGENVRVRSFWGGSAEKLDQSAHELLAGHPEVILVEGGAALQALQRAKSSTPTVFLLVPDPVGAGYAETLARPGGHITGFTNFDYGSSAKWLELLKQIKPDVRTAGVLRDPGATSGTAQFAAMRAVAASFGIELLPLPVSDVDVITNAVKAFAAVPSRGLIVAAGALALRHRRDIVRVAADHRLPAVYPYRYFAADGGLLSYGPEPLDQFRRAAGYVDRILKGESPAVLPIQAPTKFEMIVNLRTAKAMDLSLPAGLLARADEVIE